MPYRQWFSADGDTIYAAQGAKSSLGRWRVGDEGDYESWWPRPDTWDAYPIVEVDGQLFWVAYDGVRHGFEMVEGQVLTVK